VWGEMFRNVLLTVNAIVNVPYWIAQSYLMQQPLGVVMCVLSFLLAGFLVPIIRFV
jgi:hypothetical protein